jgi:hypothetical protein
MSHIKKIFLTIFIFTALFSYIPAVWAATDSPKGPTLELTYPIIPGEITPTTVSEGLPQYIKYIFSLAMVLIGIIIFLVLIYNGFLWFTSAGSADKLKTAKDGITAAFLGSLILFSAYIIFRTINPQLTILKLENPDAIEPKVFAGIYLCNYNIDSSYISNLIKDYKNENKDIRLDATKKIKEVMDNKNGRCFRINTSASFLDFAFAPQGVSSQNIPKDTLFQIPEKRYELNEETGETLIFWDYNYGIALHQRDGMRGKCQVFIYSSMDPHPSLSFNVARSATLFRKPFTEPMPESKGTILYECLDFNNASFCPRDVKYAYVTYIYPKGKDYETVLTKELLSRGLANKDTKDEKIIHSEVRSIQIDPEGYYLAVLFDEDNLTSNKTCEIISQNDNNLLDNPIGQCGDDCNTVINDKNTSTEELNSKCYPCTKSIMVIKGAVI